MRRPGPPASRRRIHAPGGWAEERRAGLIVMGAYGRNRITEYFLGSNSAAVVRTLPIAVLVAR